MKFTVMTLLLSIILVISQVLKAHIARRESERQFLLTKWEHARKNRLWWKDDHTVYFNFEDREYQKLFELEIGAEELYHLHTNKWLMHAHIHMSWDDYQMEKKFFEQENSI